MFHVHPVEPYATSMKSVDVKIILLLLMSRSTFVLTIFLSQNVCQWMKQTYLFVLTT